MSRVPLSERNAQSGRGCPFPLEYPAQTHIRQVAEITGLHPETISRGGEELTQKLLDRPTDRVRLPGGGRPRVEKKILPSKRILFAW